MATGPLTDKQVLSLHEYTVATRDAMRVVDGLVSALAARESTRDEAQQMVNNTKRLLEKAKHTYDMENRRLTLFVSGFQGPGGYGQS